MNLKEYYKNIYPLLKRAFEDSHYVLGYGHELISRGWDPDGLLVTVEPVENLYSLTAEQGLEVFLPVMNSKNRQNIDSVLMPFDFEVFHPRPQDMYENKSTQKYYFEKYVVHVEELLKDMFENYKIPHVEDWTPSGGHFLTRVARGSYAWDELKKISYLNDKALPAYYYKDPNDLKRNPAIEDAGYVFSGISTLAEYMALKTAYELGVLRGMPVSLWDSKRDTTLSVDISWTSNAGHMRIIRSPFSAHKKRSQKYHMRGPSLVDVIGRYYNPNENLDIHEKDLNQIINNFWELDNAVSHSHNFPGNVPYTHHEIVGFINEFKNSELKTFFDYCYQNKPQIDVQEIMHHIRHNPKIDYSTKHMMDDPHPRMLQPNAVRHFVSDLTLNGYHPGNIMDIFEYRYNGPWDWHRDNKKDPPIIKAEAFVRQFSALALIETGQMRL